MGVIIKDILNLKKSVKVYRNAEIGGIEKRIGSSLTAKSIRLP